MGLDHPHTKAGVGEFGVAISGGVWVAIRDLSQRHEQMSYSPCSGVGSVQQGVLRQVCVALGCLHLPVAQDVLDLKR